MNRSIFRQILHQSVVENHGVLHDGHHVDWEPVVERRDQNRVVVQLSRHLATGQIFLLQLGLFLGACDRLAPRLLLALRVHIDCHKNVFTLLANPTSFMVRVHEALPAQHSAPIRLNSFLALFDLLLSHKFDLHPIIGIVLREVVRVLPIVQGRHLLLRLLRRCCSLILRSRSFRSQILHLLRD